MRGASFLRPSCKSTILLWGQVSRDVATSSDRLKNSLWGFDLQQKHISRLKRECGGPGSPEEDAHSSEMKGRSSRETVKEAEVKVGNQPTAPKLSTRGTVGAGQPSRPRHQSRTRHQGSGASVTWTLWNLGTHEHRGARGLSSRNF